MSERLLEVDGVSKEYRLGQIGGGTLHDDLTTWLCRLRGKEDPNTKLGVDSVNYKKGAFLALDDVRFSVDRGDALAIVGLNGAGKSTLLKLISRITAPTKGEIRIHGRVASLLEIGTGFHHELSGRDNIYLNGAILGMSRAEVNAKLREIIEFSEIEQFIDTPVKRYSSGMYVKLAFAVAAHLAPDLLICDEVLAVGDLAFQQKCINKMSDVARDGRAVLYVSHNMRTITQLCNRGVYLEKGRLTYDGTVEHSIELYSGSGLRSLDRDLDKMSRPLKRGDTMRMLRMQMKGTANLEYQMDSTMEFTLTSISHVAEPHVRLRIMLYSSMAAPIAMTQSDPFEVGKEETFTVNVKMPMDGLAPGEYGMKMSLISATPNGLSCYYDTILDVGHFIIVDDPSISEGFVWQERLWGNFRLRKLSLQGGQCPLPTAAAKE